jgi:hypothetical protein
MKNKFRAIYGANPGEAWTDAAKCDEISKVCSPSEEAVEIAKSWVEENQK